MVEKPIWREAYVPWRGWQMSRNAWCICHQFCHLPAQVLFIILERSFRSQFYSPDDKIYEVLDRSWKLPFHDLRSLPLLLVRPHLHAHNSLVSGSNLLPAVKKIHGKVLFLNLWTFTKLSLLYLFIAGKPPFQNNSIRY
jgi:hypothetical protein